MRTLRTAAALCGMAIVLFSMGVPAQAGNYAAEVMADSPVSYWQLEEAGGPTATDSADGSHGTYNGGVTYSTPAHAALGGTCVTFDGSSGYIQLPGTWGGTGWAEATVEAWVKTAAPITGDFQAIVSPSGSGFAHFQLHSGGSTGFYTNGGGAFVTPPPATPEGVWRHIVLVGESGNTRVYVDGAQVGAASTTAFTQVNSASNVHIGNGYAGARWFKGQIDEVAIYNTALSEERILAHYHAVNPDLLTLVETGGTFAPGNLAAASAGATPFALNQHGSNHVTSKLNDESYGNTDSWIGSTDLSFGGVKLAGPAALDHIAWGRDNGGEATQYTDRCKGNYTVQYTTVANPGAGTPDSSWTTLASVEYTSATPTPYLRHLYEFPALFATGVRIITDRNEALGPHYLALDEIEAYNNGPLKLVETGGTFATERMNLGASYGATPFAAASFNNDSHKIIHLNDGLYGNTRSWIGSNLDSFCGIDLNGMFEIDGVAWGRDNDGVAPEYTDRCMGVYTLQYTTVANPDETTPDGDWTTIGEITYGNFDGKQLRHLYDFDTVYASGVRLLVSSNDPNGHAICIDELEVYGTPEPTTLTLLGLGALGLLARRRRR